MPEMVSLWNHILEVQHKYKFKCSLKVTLKCSLMNALFVVKKKKKSLMSYSPERPGAVAQ